MDVFRALTASYGLKPQGKSAPMASAKQATIVGDCQTRNFGIDPILHSKSTIVEDHNRFSGFTDSKNQHFGGLEDGINIFGGPNKPASQSSIGGVDSSDCHSISMGSNNSVSTPSASSYVDDILDRILDRKSAGPAKTDYGFSAFSSPPMQNTPFVDLQGFIGSSITNNSREPAEMNKPSKQTDTTCDSPFWPLQTTSACNSSGSFPDQLVQTSILNNSGGTGVNSLASVIDELEEFARDHSRTNARAHIHASEINQNSVGKTDKSKGAPDSAEVNQFKTINDLKSLFSTGSQSSSTPESRAATLAQTFDGQMQNKRRSEVPQRVPSGSTASMKKSQ